MDELLVALTPRYAGVLADYERVVRQRSALLKSVVGTWRRDDSYETTLDVWNDQLIRLGSELTYARLGLLDQLGPPLEGAYSTVAPENGHLSASYESQWLTDVGVSDATGSQAAASKAPSLDLITASLTEAVGNRRRPELERGLTLVGPHRDDLLLTLGGLPAKGYASHGESWSIALSLRLATFTLQRQTFDAGGDPVLLLDDVFAELDSRRRARLADIAVEAEQVLVTAAVAADVPEVLRGRTLSVQRTTEGVSRTSW
jgi:DNA replication and repair protein RecF